MENKQQSICFLIDQLEREGATQLCYILDTSQVNEESINESLLKLLQEQGLEVLEAKEQNEYIQFFHIQTRGFVIFVKKHCDSDADHSVGFSLGHTAFEAFNKILILTENNNIIGDNTTFEWNCSKNIEKIQTILQQLDSLELELAYEIMPELSDLLKVEQHFKQIK